MAGIFLDIIFLRAFRYNTVGALEGAVPCPCPPHNPEGWSCHEESIIASLLIACSLFIGGNTDARAEYPYDKPINIIVPFGPGGGVDIAARILADYFQQNYNITINVVNKPGGAQAIGINEMLRAVPTAIPSPSPASVPSPPPPS